MDLQNLRDNPFFNPESKLFFVSGAVALGLIWWAMNLTLAVIGNPLGTDSSQEEYFLLLSFSSLLITYLLGYLLFTMISLDSIVQKKYNDIMNSLVYDDEGKKIYPGDPRQNFTSAQWVRLSITQHLDLLEVAGTSDKNKAAQLKLMLENIEPNEDPLQYADTAFMLSKKLTNLGEFEEAESMCRTCLENLLPEHKTAFGQIKAALGVVLKRTGKIDEAMNELGDAVGMISKEEPLRWVRVNKAFLRLQFLAHRTIPEPIVLEEIHGELRALCQSNFGTKSHVDAWRLSRTLESYYDLYSIFLASKGQLQWALRYSWAAVVLAENRTGQQASTYSTSHLSRLLMLDGDFENADNMLNMKAEFLEKRGDSRGWLTYNMARCKFGLADFEAAIGLYNETIEMKSTDAETTLKAYIGLSYAHMRLGNDLMADSMKLKADEFAANTGIKAVWEEPNTSDADNVQETEDTWVVNQHKLTWREAMKLAKTELGITSTKYPKKGTEYYNRTMEIHKGSQTT
jgi:tetratricopeptide (TPR) repeat protein